MKKLIQTTAVLLILITPRALAAEYECPVTKKLGGDGQFRSDEDLSKWQISVKISDQGSTAVVSRCSFSSSAKRVTCDDYAVDHIAKEEFVGHKKFYNFNSQFDVQLFANLKFVENNGRGSIAFGTCRLVKP